VCGETQSGFDQGPSDLGMAQCENGHVFCDDHLIDWPEPKDTPDEVETDEDTEMLEEYEEEYDDCGQNQDGDYHVACCPICQMEAVSEYEMNKYLMKITGRTKADLVEEIVKRFKTYEEFDSFLNDRMKEE